MARVDQQLLQVLPNENLRTVANFNLLEGDFNTRGVEEAIVGSVRDLLQGFIGIRHPGVYLLFYRDRGVWLPVYVGLALDQTIRARLANNGHLANTVHRWLDQRGLLTAPRQAPDNGQDWPWDLRHVRLGNATPARLRYEYWRRYPKAPAQGTQVRTCAKRLVEFRDNPHRPAQTDIETERMQALPQYEFRLRCLIYHPRHVQHRVRVQEARVHIPQCERLLIRSCQERNPDLLNVRDVDQVPLFLINGINPDLRNPPQGIHENEPEIVDFFNAAGLWRIN